MTGTPRPTIWVRDLAGTQVDAIGHDFLKLNTDWKLFAHEQLLFQVEATHAKASRLIPDAELVFDARVYRIAEAEHVRDGNVVTVEIEADALWYQLGDTTYVGTFSVEAATPRAGVAAILAPTSWTVSDQSTTSAATFSMEADDQTLLALLYEWQRVTGTYLEFDTFSKQVIIRDAIGLTVAASFRYGRNLRKLIRRERPPELTRLFPYGADDLTISGVNGGTPYVEDLSYYTSRGLTAGEAADRFTRDAVWVDGRFVNETNLLAAAQRRLARLGGQLVDYDLEVIDLSGITGVQDRVEPGNKVRVFDPDVGDDVTPFVIRRIIDHIAPENNRLELALAEPVPPAIGSASSRVNLADQWVQFVGPIRANYEIRNDGDYRLGRIPLRFRDGARANFHFDVFMVGVGSGTAHVSIRNSADELQFEQVDVPYTNGETVRAIGSWAVENLSGATTYFLEITTTADGGPSASAGVDVALDRGADDVENNEYESSFWVMAQGALRETATTDSSVRFDYVANAPQQWTVPENVEEVTVQVVGAGGGASGSSGGAGGSVTCTFAVIPGTTYDIYAPKAGVSATGGWPGGGNGAAAAPSNGMGGGGYAAIIPAGGSLTSAVVVAAGGGGAGNGFPTTTAGGAGGYLTGQPGGSGGGGGATQSAGGIGQDTGNNKGGDGTFGQGGVGEPASAFDEPGGGGGGGWYGGGGGGSTGSTGYGGGGGSGYIDPAIGAYAIETADGFQSGNGFVEFSWSVPVL